MPDLLFISRDMAISQTKGEARPSVCLWRCLFVLFLVFLMTSEGFAGWLIFHKPEFKGRVIDVETKVPTASLAKTNRSI